MSARDMYMTVISLIGLARLEAIDSCFSRLRNFMESPRKTRIINSWIQTPAV